MCEIREIMKIVLVQFYQIYLISLFKYIGSMSVTNSNCSCCRLPLSISYMQWFGDSCWKYSICSALNVEYTRQSNTYTPCYETVNGWAPSLLFQQVGPLLYYFNGWAPSLLFQRVGPLLYYFNRWGPFFIISSGGPLLYYFKGWGPFFIISTDWVFFII